MKKLFISFLIVFFILTISGCANSQDLASVVATTKPIYDFTAYLCQGTDITVSQLITENVSCLHDYTIQVHQMRAIEAAEIVVISGVGLEEFLNDALQKANIVLDASQNIETLCGEHHHEEESGSHHHDNDPHIWMSTTKAEQMAVNIYSGLSENYPEYKEIFQKNLIALENKFEELEAYGNAQLSTLSTRNLITFHDGFAYLAEQWDLTILKAVEEESGSEASAAELIDLVHLIRQNDLPAIFTEESGSTSAANIISRETDVPIFTLSMGMSEQDYFNMMYNNINTIKEALG